MNGATGAREWIRASGSYAVSSSPAAANGVVDIGSAQESDFANMYAFGL